jgi:pectinesterase
MKTPVLALLLTLTAAAWAGEADDYYSVVALDGSGDFTGIQDAIDHTKAFPDKRIILFIKNGIYREKVKVHEWNTLLALIGESREKTIITFDDHFKKINRGRNSTFHTATVQVDGDDFRMQNLTVVNAAGQVGQAVALAVNADRAYFDSVNIVGNQDTLYLTGEGKRQYFKDCYIEGTTDFIFGGATAVFENCRIHSKADSYITAASTPQGVDYGFVFIGCRLTADKGVNKVYLGRPWRLYAKTVFIDTYMGPHIAPEGWHGWSRPAAPKTVYYAEYGSTGEGANADRRVSWSNQLSKKQADRYRPEKIFGKRAFSAMRNER